MTLGPARNYIHFRSSYASEPGVFLVWIDADNVPIVPVSKFAGKFLGAHNNGAVFSAGEDARLKLPFISRMYVMCKNCWEGRACELALSIRAPSAFFHRRNETTARVVSYESPKSQPRSQSPVVMDQTREKAARLLGVSIFASTEEVEKAFKTKAKTAHPDRGGSEETFKDLVAARDLLLGKTKVRSPS